MRQLLLVVFLFVLNSAISQVLSGDIKSDSVYVISDSSKVIVFKRGKARVVSCVSGKLMLKSTRFPLFYLEEHDLFIEVREDGFNFIYVIEGGKKVTTITEDVNNSWIEFPDTLNGLNDVFSLNGNYIDFVSGYPVKEPTVKTKFFKREALNFQKREDGLIVMNYVGDAIESENEWDQDYLRSPGFSKSGIYNSKIQKWIVPQQYHSCQLIGDNAICAKVDTVIYEMSPDGFHGRIKKEFSYDQFKLEDGAAQLVTSRIKSIEDLNLKVFFDADSVQVLNRGDCVKIHKSGKQGLVKITLFGENYQGKYPDFKSKQLLAPKFDFILADNRINEILTYQKQKRAQLPKYDFVPTSNQRNEKEISQMELVEPFVVYQVQNDRVFKVSTAKGSVGLSYEFDFQKKLGLISVKSDETFLSPYSIDSSFSLEEIKEEELSLIRCPLRPHTGYNLGFELVRDSFLIVEQRQKDTDNLFLGPLKSMEYPEEDSIIYDEIEDAYIAVYPQLEKPLIRSGVFNLNSKKWLITPKNWACYANQIGFLIDHNGGMVNEEVNKEGYSLITDKGDYLYQELPIDSFSASTNYRNLLLKNFRVNQLETAPTKVSPIYNEGYVGKEILIRDSLQGWSIICPIVEEVVLHPELRTKPKEFIYHKASTNYYLWIENDSIYAEIQDSVYSVSEQFGEIEIEQIKEPNSVVVRLKEKENRVIFKMKNEHDFSGAGDMPQILSIAVKGKDLIINDRGNYTNLSDDNYDFFTEEYSTSESLVEFEFEGSSIWRKENEIWQRKTPYYASIQKIPFGYLARIGSSFTYNSFGVLETSNSESVIVLDSNFKAISYYDFFDFPRALIHDFGMEICIEQGCFFVNNNGVIITTAKWHAFALENGKLKAIRYKVEVTEKDWKLAPENRIEEIAYFDL